MEMWKQHHWVQQYRAECGNMGTHHIDHWVWKSWFNHFGEHSSNHNGFFLYCRCKDTKNCHWNTQFHFHCLLWLHSVPYLRTFNTTRRPIEANHQQSLHKQVSVVLVHLVWKWQSFQCLHTFQCIQPISISAQYVTLYVTLHKYLASKFLVIYIFPTPPLN